MGLLVFYTWLGVLAFILVVSLIGFKHRQKVGCQISTVLLRYFHVFAYCVPMHSSKVLLLVKAVHDSTYLFTSWWICYLQVTNFFWDVRTNYWRRGRERNQQSSMEEGHTLLAHQRVWQEGSILSLIQLFSPETQLWHAPSKKEAPPPKGLSQSEIQGNKPYCCLSCCHILLKLLYKDVPTIKCARVRK